MKVGDRVRVVGRTDVFNGLEGVVVQSIRHGQLGVSLDAIEGKHGQHWFFPDELESTQRQGLGSEGGNGQ